MADPSLSVRTSYIRTKALAHINSFRVHEYNTNAILLTFLPYHETAIFLNLLSILPDNIGGAFHFLHPYVRSVTTVPRQSIVYNATNNAAFFTALNNYVLKVCREQQHYHGLLSFWSGITAEAVAGMLESAQSGRREIQQQKEEDVFLKLGPILDEALTLTKVPELRLGSYMTIIVLANKADLKDKILDGLMEGLLVGCPSEAFNATVLCLSILAQRKQARRLPRKVIKAVARIQNLESIVFDLSQKYNMAPFTHGFINGVLHQVERGKGLAHLQLIEKLLLCEDALDRQAIEAVLTSLLKTAQNLPSNENQFAELRNSYSDMFQRLNESTLGTALQKLLKDNKVDIAKLEMNMQSVLAIQDVEIPDEMEGIEVAKDVEQDREEAFFLAFESVPERTVDEASLLTLPNSHVFSSLEKAFLSVTKVPQYTVKFMMLPILQQDEESGNPLFWSFFVRFLCGAYPAQARVSVIRLARIRISELGLFQPLLQMIFPYILFALADPMDAVRNATCELIVALKDHYELPGSHSETDTSLGSEQFASFYGISTTETVLLPRTDLSKLLNVVFIPFLEEISLDPNRAGLTVERALQGSSTASQPRQKSSLIDLKKSLRHNFFMYLKCHIVNTPLFGVKLRLLGMLGAVEKVGSTSCSKEFLPLLKDWAAFSEDDVNKISVRESIEVVELENKMSSIISANDRETLGYWLLVMKDPASTPRSSFRKALFDRIQTIWPSMKADRQLAAAEFLLEGALDPHSNGSSSCREVLHSVRLRSEVLAHLVETTQRSVTELPDKPSPSKRRRTSKTESSTARLKVLEEHGPVIQKMTFILELVDSSKPEQHPMLFGKLFDILATLQQFKSRVQSELAYVQNLALSSLLAIAKESRHFIAIRHEITATRADLVVECIRHLQSHQVQNTALLLIANLAGITPDLVLHSVMPIFTFLGDTILRNTDEYSKYVIDQTIDEVVPQLVQSLRNQKRDVVTGTAELLQSFTAAFEHIPSHRRLRLFQSLVSKLGPDEFLFAVIAVIAEKYQSNTQVKTFAVTLTSDFGLRTVLNSFKEMLRLAEDSLQPNPSQAGTLLGVGREGGQDSSSIVRNLFQMLSHLLRDRSLTARVNRALEDETIETAEVRSILSDLVEQTLDLSETLKEDKQALSSCNDVLGSLLRVLSITELIRTTTHLLNRDDDDFRRRILKLLEARIRTTSSNATSVFTAALEFLPTLTMLIEDTAVPTLRQAAVACVDRICDKYGKKDSSKVMEAAKVIAGESCLGQSDERTQVISTLCLASIIEVIGEAIVPVLPGAIPRALELLEISIKEDEEKPRLHNAVYSFFSALLGNLAWMVSGSQLDQLLKISFESANADMGEECDVTRKDVAQLLAKKVDFKQLITAIGSTWPEAVLEGPDVSVPFLSSVRMRELTFFQAASEALSMLNTAIEKSRKSSIVNNAQRLGTLFFKTLDLRRVQLADRTEDSYEEDEVAQVEAMVNEVAIKMIYKMNDSTFRPLFVSLIEWATSELSRKDAIGRTLRLTTLYTFLDTFFETLKVTRRSISSISTSLQVPQSIVTTYASYIIDNAVEILTNINPKDPSSRTLWQAVILALTRSFEHDQDEFWQSPHHFSAISVPLLSQLAHATTPLPIQSHLIPALVSLATMADSPDHHKALNTAIMKHMRSDYSSVRLAAVKTEVALTERLGEEWLGLLPEMLPFISEGMEDDDEGVEREVRRWVVIIEGILGESLEGMLQ